MGSIGDQGKDSDNQVALAGTVDDGIHRLVARIYFADTDFSGAVYHGRYLEFLERGRSDFLRCVGVHHTDLLQGSEGEALIWVVRAMTLEFHQPARIDDIITVHTVVEQISGARVMMGQRVMRGATMLVSATVTAAITNGEGKPRRFPKHWQERFVIAPPVAKN